MKFIAIFLGIVLNFLHVENKIIYESVTPAIDEPVPEAKIDPRTLEKVLGLKSYRMDDEKDLEEYSFEVEKKRPGSASTKKPCAIVVLSNSQNPSMQSLLRKYRYDANGILIPSSVQYYIKLPQAGMHTDPVLVPLNDRAFSPLGGFVRYYKEVPPIPQSW